MWAGRCGSLARERPNPRGVALGRVPARVSRGNARGTNGREQRDGDTRSSATGI